MRLRAASTLLLVVLACHFAAAQPVIIDDFEADLDLIRSVSPDLDLPSTDPFTFLNPAVLGGETDVILNLVDAPDAASGVQVFGADGSFAIQSDPGTASRVFIVFDGMDGDAVRVLASGGLNGADLTRAGANDHFVLDIDNSGSALNISVDIYSSLETRSNLIVPIPAGWSGPLEIPFSDFAPVDSPADISSVNAMIMIVGAGGGGLGGAPGPIDLRINDFTAFGPPPVIPGGSGGGVIVDQLQTPVGDEWYITDFGGSNPFNALIQDDFVITATNGLTIQTVEFDGFYRPSPPSNPTADVIIRADNNGAPGDIVTTLPSLPVKAASDKTYSVDLGVNSPLLQTGTYWIGMQGNVPVGTEILTHSTSTPQGSPAHWENPGGAFGRSCPSATPLTSCGSSDESWRYKLISDFDPTAVDLNLDKDVEPDKVVLGDSITFTLVVTNFSEHTATGVHVADRLSGISNIMATSSQGSCSVSSEGALDCDVGSLESGASATITVTGQANSTTHTSNTAWASSAEHDSDPINNTFKTEWVVGRPISISKASTYDEYLPGNKIDFNMTITNTTSIPYSDLVLEDIYFNDQFKYVDATRDCINVQHTLTSTLSCAIPDIQPATTITYTTTMQALSPPAKSTNYAQVLDGAIVYGFGNRVVHVSDRWYLSDLNFVAVGGWDGGGAASSKSSQSGGAVDLYLGDTKVGEDLAFGQSTGWFTDTLGGDPKKLYIVPADSSDVTAAIDSLELLVDPGLPPGGGSSLVILVDDAAGDASTLVMDGVRREAADPGLAEVVVVNAAPNLGPITSFVDLPSSPAILAEDLTYGGFGPYTTVDPPGTYNYTVTPPDDGSTVPEVFRIATESPGQVYTIVVAPDTVARYSVIALDGTGSRIEAPIVTGVEDEPELPIRLALHQNYPNPFSGVTEIEYDVPSATDVHLSLFDITGRRVGVLDAGQKAAGRHRVMLDANGVAPGVYFYRLSVGDWSAAKRMVVVR